MNRYRQNDPRTTYERLDETHVLCHKERKCTHCGIDIIVTTALYVSPYDGRETFLNRTYDHHTKAAADQCAEIQAANDLVRHFTRGARL